MALVVGTNSYVDVATASTYFQHAIHASAWRSASNNDKTSALVTATRMLDRQRWLGEKYQPAPTQVLDWPRSGLVDEEGQPIDETTVPQFVLDATCELGLQLISNAAVQDQNSTGSNIKSLKAGSAEIEYFATGTSGTRFPTIVQELIGQYLEGALFSGPFASGSDAESQIGDYGRSEGVF